MSDINHIKNLIINHKRRLQKLQEQNALQGNNTPAYILIEIDDAKSEIKRLKTVLKAKKDFDDGEPEIHYNDQPKKGIEEANMNIDLATTFYRYFFFLFVNLLDFGKQSILPAFNGGVSGLLGGIWIWVVVLPFAKDAVESYLMSSGYDYCKYILSSSSSTFSVLQLLILLSGGVGGAGLGICISGYTLVENFVPEWLRQPVLYQITVLVVTLFLALIVGVAGGTVMGLIATQDTFTASLLFPNIFKGILMTLTICSIVGGGIAFTMIISATFAKKLPNLLYHFTIVGIVTGALAGLAIVFISKSAIDFLVGLASIVAGGEDMECTMIVWLAMVTVPEPVRWFGGPVVGAIFGGFVVSQIGKQLEDS